MLSKSSVRKPYTVIVGIILVIVLGVISFQRMTTDLLPSMDLPYVVVYTTYVGATPEQVEADITRPMEASFATLTDVKKITSSSRDNVSVVVMQFNDGANMDTALIEISSKLDQLRGGWDDSIGAPVTMKLNPDMLPVAILSVTRDDMDIYALSDYVNDELAPAFEALNGVASANASGLIEQKIDVTIEQSRIDVLNKAILRDIDAELADVEAQLDEAQAKLSDGKRQLARAKKEALAKIDQALEAIEKGEEAIGPAIAQLTVQRAELIAQREALAATLAGLEAAVNLTDAQKAQLAEAAAQLAELKQQREALAQQLAELQAKNPEDPETAARREDILAQRAELLEQKAALEAYLSDLNDQDADALKDELAALEQRVAANETALTEAQAARDTTAAQRAELNDQLTLLAAMIAEAEGVTPEPVATAAPETEAPETEAPTAEATPEITVAPTEAPTEAPEATPEVTVAPAEPFSALRRWRAAQAEGIDLATMRQLMRAGEAQLAQLDAQLAEQQATVDELQAALDADRASLTAKKAALAAAQGDGESLESRREETERQIAALDDRIAALDEELAALDAQGDGETGGDDEEIAALKQQIAALDAQIDALERSDAIRAALMLSDPDALNAQYAEAQAGLAQLDAGIAKIDETLDKLNQGIIPAGYIEGVDEDTKLSDAKAQLEAARKQAQSGFAQAASAISEGEAELASARAEFIEQRDEALKNAGLDGVITVQMVGGIIGAQNFSMPAGYVYDLNRDQVLVRVGDQFASLDELKRMKLFELGLDSIDEVRLSDVAAVVLADNREDVFTKLDGLDGIILSFDKQSTYSTAEVADTILAKAEALMAANPELHIVDLMNQGEYINIIVDSVLNNLLSGGALAILILLLFLMDWRPTLTVAFSIPISVVIAFVCMYFSGITLNVLSLSGLSLGIGMLVDNSIVSIENIYRLHEEEGYPLLKACVEGVKSVSGALIASTLTTICVFLPIVFVKGMARDLFSDMGLSIAFSLLASLLVAMTVVPMMCSFLMRKSKPRKHRVFGAIQKFYIMLLRGALRVKPLVLLAALALLAFSAWQVPKMGISFMPEVNSRQMSADLTFDPDMSTADQRTLALDIMNDMMAVEGVETVGLMGGSGGLLSGLSGGSGGMSYYIIVDEASGRRNTDIAADFDAIALRRSADLSTQASTMDISMMTGSGIQVEISGEDIETLQAIARDVAQLARDTAGTADVDDGMEDAVPEMRIVVDKEKAIDEGLTTAQVFQFIATKLAGESKISQVTLDGKSFNIYLIDGKNSDLTPEDLEDLEIEVTKEDEDKLVRIGDIAAVRETTAMSTISRVEQKRTVTVSFAIADGYSANLVSDAFEEKLNAYAMPAGYTASLAGENETVMGIMEDLVFMVIIAILLIFLIMVAQFQSFKSPIIVMFTIPLAFTGGLLALLLTGMDLSIVSMIGFLVLSGVVVNNGIVFIDCVNQLRIGGMSKREALLETGRMRLRPILMTALTTILGMSTMALGHGTGAEMMQPMAVVSIGGLTYATLMTLFVVPVLYDLLNGKTMKAREIQMIKEAAGMNGDALIEGGADAPAQSPEAAIAAEPEVRRTPATEAEDVYAPATPVATKAEAQAPVAEDVYAPATPVAAKAEAQAPVVTVAENAEATAPCLPVMAKAAPAVDPFYVGPVNSAKSEPPTPVFQRPAKPEPPRAIKVKLGKKK